MDEKKKFLLLDLTCHFFCLDAESINLFTLIIVLSSGMAGMFRGICSQPRSIEAQQDFSLFNLSVAACKIVINHFRLPGR